MHIIAKTRTFFFLALQLAAILLCPTALSYAGDIRPLDNVAIAEIEPFLADETHLIIRAGASNHAFTIELATDEDTRMKGLMYRTSLAPGHGMLFDFEKTDQVYMWMKNTYISLDMIFADPDGTIHHIVRGTTPLSESIIGSAGAVRYVLEVPKGTADALNIKEGDRLLHQLFTPKRAK
ncbi:DUF192 domain-containing protein [uncultured Cohaesibacter sp.]|uniref:DUF192 domain-containing protein n=1 Tax=uncultured Cohaesibacter sp. TaxID=1002546 RepID=UPI0029C692B5|nr:DUF192 domain-containing protein [uncultured Cohaesibacter sp.]